MSHEDLKFGVPFSSEFSVNHIAALMKNDSSIYNALKEIQQFAQLVRIEFSSSVKGNIAEAGMSPQLLMSTIERVEFQRRTSAIVQDAFSKYEIHKLDNSRRSELLVEVIEHHSIQFAIRRPGMLSADYGGNNCLKARNRAYSNSDNTYVIAYMTCLPLALSGPIFYVTCVVGATANMILCYNNADVDYKDCTDRDLERLD